MLSVRPKITELNFNLFARNLHPELFEITRNRVVQREHYQLELNITTDGHLIVFRHEELILCEICSSANHPLPETGKLYSLSVDRKLSNDLVYGDRISYRSNVELETVPPKTFVTIQQQLDPKIECEGLVHRFESNGRIAFGALSYVNVQAFSQHVNIRTLHTFPDTSSILKSELALTLCR